MKTSQRFKKTCNLRMTAIRALIAYAAKESIDITALYVNAKALKGLTVLKKEIEYFEEEQLKALLAAPPNDTKNSRRNRMILILSYDAGLHISKLIDLKISYLRLDAEVPYVTIFERGSKYGSVPLMSKTVEHLNIYLEEFHPVIKMNTPRFYITTHGIIHTLSNDTMQNLLKKYTEKSRRVIKMMKDVHFHMLRKTSAMNQWIYIRLVVN